MKSRMRTEIEQAEVNLRRGVFVGIVAAVSFWAVVIMLTVAIGFAR